MKFEFRATAAILAAIAFLSGCSSGVVRSGSAEPETEAEKPYVQPDSEFSRKLERLSKGSERASSASPAGETPGGGCVIKGNVSFSTGERIYHVPGWRYYDATTIDPSYWERWFCSEEEAEGAGWRRSKL